MTFSSFYQQNFPSKPAFTEKDIPPGSQVGKVFLVTGANQGVGFELVKMLYASGATIYLAGRSLARIEAAIETLTALSPQPALPAKLKPLFLDLADLATVKPAATVFGAQEVRLDILWNNAGVGGVAKGSSTKQGLEAHIGINCVAPLMLTQLLLPYLQAAVRMAPEGSIRVIWTGSYVLDTTSPTGGIDYKTIESPETTTPVYDYAVSKAGNWLLAAETARRWGERGVISAVLNPGYLSTNINSGQPRILKILQHPASMGGNTMLYAGFSSDICLENSGTYIYPFGKVATHSRLDIYAAIEDGKAGQFWNWCESKYGNYA